ncbi:hypothetical protein B0T26DRAFT_691454 [Lasiosphaeria miniovina]|uniref:non-specific serine/threonine protein kinase n=1 Tax=Lasiosphaeria miniovina TaxID=1954250 RepID=A0AA40B2W9_9PEZI|nr:uncharacterized protein B0T26DRAFT_691454 [Lasiosphaeria miniovina]KAK0726699.1 hypothetical protein B0T26DRAFT_691454 [Lasiosphaeria miniovina]
MRNLQLADFDYSATKLKAIEDARKAQLSIVRQCAEAGKEPPPYLLAELIGKGSFGRVYKATGTRTRPGQLVAVKIISIEEGDTLSPGAADTFNDILKEVNTLKMLTTSGARNINAVVDTLLVDQSVWIVTEYCGGGSVSSLMRPTGGLPEKWIIPILREVAEAIFWVHRQGIIHRDIKCANVLVTETGGVQLCDFGVAGIMETKFDKRSTVTGTLQWMAPELFDSNVSYGMEVDIWAFGSMAYEVASGLPPNATTSIDIPQFGSYLKQYCPRLEGDQYSAQLKSLVAFCLVEDPRQRPRIEQVQKHPYVFDTYDGYPTASLSKLVSAYKLWESQGGSRRSLFSAGGAQGAPEDLAQNLEDDEWDFTEDDEADQFRIENTPEAQAVLDAYAMSSSVPEQDAPQKPNRRRRQPRVIKEFKAPLERVFDPNTITNYGDSARVFYGKLASPPPNDLPLRDGSDHSTLRESMIDLDASHGNLETLKPGLGAQPFSGAPTDDTDRRKTQDWTFPSMPAPAPASLGLGHYQSRSASALGGHLEIPPAQTFHSSDDASFGSGFHPDISITPSQSNNRESSLSLIDLNASLVSMADDIRPATATADPYPFSHSSHLMAQPNRASNLSLIDLDASLVSMPVDIVRPSTAQGFSFPGESGLTAPSNRASNMSLIDLDASFVPDLDWQSSAAGPRILSTSSSTASTLVPSYANRASNMSLIDLDASLVDGFSSDVTRPSTAGSQATSPSSMTGSMSFDLEFEARSLPPTSYPRSYREPSMYITDETDLTLSLETLEVLRSATPSPSPPRDDGRMPSALPQPRRDRAWSKNSSHFSDDFPSSSVPPLPPLPMPPSANVLQGISSRDQLKNELQSMIANLNEHLQYTADYLRTMPTVPAWKQHPVRDVFTH